MMKEINDETDLPKDITSSSANKVDNLGSIHSQITDTYMKYEGNGKIRSYESRLNQKHPDITSMKNGTELGLE